MEVRKIRKGMVNQIVKEKCPECGNRMIEDLVNNLKVCENCRHTESGSHPF